MTRRFVERWLPGAPGGTDLVVWHDVDDGRFVVVEGDRVVFAAAAFADVLAWMLAPASSAAPKRRVRGPGRVRKRRLR